MPTGHVLVRLRLVLLGLHCQAAYAAPSPQLNHHYQPTMSSHLVHHRPCSGPPAIKPSQPACNSCWSEDLIQLNSHYYDDINSVPQHHTVYFSLFRNEIWIATWPKMCLYKILGSPGGMLCSAGCALTNHPGHAAQLGTY